MDILVQQLRYAIRSIRRTPVVSAVIITTLSISIALVTTFFGFVNSVFYHPLPYPDAKRTISLSHLGNLSIELNELARTTHALQSIATFRERPAILTLDTASTEIAAAKVDTVLFSMLKVGPIVGSLPTRDELRSDARIVVIGERLWRSRFGSRPDIVGVTITLDDVPRRVIGVMPAWFRFPSDAEAWYPFGFHEASGDQLYGIGRLADGASLADAEREASLVHSRLRAGDPNYPRWGGLWLSPHMVNRADNYNTASMVWLVVGGALCVLLIACTNIAALMLAREARRRGETIIRASLGASGWQLVRQQLIESVVLACASGMIGIVLSVWCTRFALQLVPPEFSARLLPAWIHIGLDGRVLLFAVGVSLMTVLLFAVWPAREAIRLDLTAALRSTADRGVTGGDPTRRLHLPVILQISLSVILLVAAATMVRSAREYGANRGYSVDSLAEVQFTLNHTRDTSMADYTRLQLRLGERMRSMGASFQVATDGRYTGLSNSPPATDFEIRLMDDRRLVRVQNEYPGWQMVSDNYFHVLGIPLIAGRPFGDREAPGPPSSVIVSRRLATDIWGTTAVIGKQLVLGKPGIPVTVIGVAENVKQIGHVEGRAALVDGRAVFFSERQVLTAPGWLSYMIRSPVPPPGVASFASSAARSLGYNLSARAIPMTLERGQAFVTHILAIIVAVFATISLMLATMGIYGMVAFSVEQRSREIGVRVALGAQGADVVRLLAVSGAKLILVGTAIGLVGCVAAGRIVTSIVLASLGGHLATAFGVAGVFVIVGGVACYLPARRSIRIDPMSLLRE